MRKFICMLNLQLFQCGEVAFVILINENLNQLVISDICFVTENKTRIIQIRAYFKS